MADSSEEKSLEEKQKEYVFSDEKKFQPAHIDHLKGVPPIKEDVEDIIEYLSNYDEYKEADARVSPGLFLFGKPGTGKTLSARVIATESEAKLVYAGEFPREKSKWRYNDIKRLFSLVKEYHDEHGDPAVVYFDEIDALCSKSQFQSRRTDAASALMSQLDGINGKMEGIMVIGATNKPDQVHGALVRPGRLGYQIAFNPPGMEGKEEILSYYLDKKPSNGNIDTMSLAYIFPGETTPAGIEQLVERAYSTACMEADGKDPEITEEHILEHSIEHVLGPPSGVWMRDNQRWIECVPGDTRIYGGNEKIKDLEEGDEIVDSEGNKQEISETYKRPYNGRVEVIKVLGAPKVKFTPEHPVLTCRFDRIHRSSNPSVHEWTHTNPEWKNAEDLEEDDWVMVPKRDCSQNQSSFTVSRNGGFMEDEQFEIELTENLAWILGMYIAEGYIEGSKSRSTRTVQFSIGSHERDLADKLVKTIESELSYLGSNPFIYDREEKFGQSCLSIKFCCKPMAEWINKTIGNGARKKRVPEFIKNSNEDIIRNFIEGWFRGDGTEGGNGWSLEIATVNKEMALDLMELLYKIGVTPSYCPSKQEGGFGDGETTMYRIRFSENAFYGEGRQCLQSREDDDYVYLPIKEVTEEDYNGYVYNLHTTDKTFSLPFVVHNSIHQSGHAIVGARVTSRDDSGLTRLVIVPEIGYQQGDSLISFRHDRFAIPMDDVKKNITTLYGGMVAEEVMRDERYLGSEDDMEKITELSLKMAAKYAEDNNYIDMADEDGREGEPGFLSEVPDNEREEIFDEARKIREECRGEAREILESFGEEGINEIADEIKEEEFMLGKTIKSRIEDIDASPGQIYEKNI